MTARYAELSDRANRFKPTDASPPRFVVNVNQDLVNRVKAIKALREDADETNVRAAR